MQKNMGTVDRLLRTVIALAVAALYFTNQITGTAALILGAFAAIFLVTSFFGFCPLYAPIKLSTRKSD